MYKKARVCLPQNTTVTFLLLTCPPPPPSSPWLCVSLSKQTIGFVGILPGVRLPRLESLTEAREDMHIGSSGSSLLPQTRAVMPPMISVLCLVSLARKATTRRIAGKIDNDIVTCCRTQEMQSCTGMHSVAPKYKHRISCKLNIKQFVK